MDADALKNKLTTLFSKYKFVLLILFLGILLMSIPTAKQEQEAPVQAEAVSAAADPAEELENILSQIEGVGRVRVLLTQATGPETIYQTDEDRSTDGAVRVETVIVSGSDRTESGLVRTVTPPTYLGAIIVCQGADRPSVRLSVVQAVSNVTGIGTDRITVLKMK